MDNFSQFEMDTPIRLDGSAAVRRLEIRCALRAVAGEDVEIIENRNRSPLKADAFAGFVRRLR